MNVGCTSQKRIAIVQPAVDKCLDFEKMYVVNISKTNTINFFQSISVSEGEGSSEPNEPPLDPPLLPWSAATSFLRNTVPVCHRARMDHNA